MLEGVRVVLVDDSPDQIEMYRLALGVYGADVRIATSAAEAVDLVARERPDVLVSDIELPDRSGYELIAAVRALGVERGGDVPAVALTGWADGADRDRALAAGFTEHRAKPFGPRELAATIAGLAGLGGGSASPASGTRTTSRGSSC